MSPGPTELFLIGFLIESIWTPRSKSKTLTPRTNSQTFWPREISHVMNGIVCCVSSTSAISVPSVNLEAMSKRTQEDAGEERVTAKSKPMMNLVSRYRVRDPNVLVSTASESPGHTKSESQNVPLSSPNVQQTSAGRLVMGASAHQTTQNGTLTASGLLKCGNLVKCRTEVRGDPFVTSLSSMMIWTLTPPQNRTFL